MKLLESLRNLTEKIRKGEYVDWTIWINRQLKNLCEFYVDYQLCQRIALEKDQYNLFVNAVTDMYNRREYLIEQMVNTTPGLKKYLQIHSVFKTNLEDHDWFSMKMADVTNATEKEVKEMFEVPDIFKELLEKFKGFDPEPILFTVDNIRIEYDLDAKNGPIIVKDMDWESIIGKSSDVEKFISQFDFIYTDSRTDDDTLLFQ
jgi:hypothetical protein